jgi:hypothetical protein
MSLHDMPAGLTRPHDLLEKLRRDFLKAVWQIVDGEAPLKLAGAIPVERHLLIELDGWPARTLGATVKAVDLASQVLVYWETLECFADKPESVQGDGGECV